MRIEINYENNKIVIENDFKYNSYVDVKHFIMDAIKTSVKLLKQ